ncbi:MAG: hypothetical protein H0T68_13785, partial [Gemmatimonadales bacterium]|nr:hypothetical protein [Gemmatimonadales bacterium]
LPAEERRYWQETLRARGEVRDSLDFPALALDDRGEPIPVVNTDPATALFLESRTTPETVLGTVAPFVRPYPVGLFVEGLGPVVANDAYASRSVWEGFRDPYHSPRVVWGREVNLLFLGLAHRIAAASDSAGRPLEPALEPYLRELHQALRHTLDAVNASGLQHAELWSYEIAGGELRPVRYGTGSDVQLWSSTDLAVEFMLSRLPRP